jgi:hypothetical protein
MANGDDTGRIDIKKMEKLSSCPWPNRSRQPRLIRSIRLRRPEAVCRPMAG